MNLASLNSNTGSDFSFSKVIFSLLITFLVLFLSGSISTFYYVFQTGSNTITTPDLIAYYGKNLFFLLQLIPFTLAFFCLILCIKYIHRYSFKKLFYAAEKFNWKKFLLSFSIWFMVMLLFFFFNYLSAGESFKWNFSSSFYPLLLISIIFVIIQTAFEELLFRGFLLKALLKNKLQALFSILLSSILFGLMHFNNPEVHLLGNLILFYFIGTGLFLALLAYCDKGLELSFGFHAANNIFASIIVTNDWQVFQTDALYIDFSPAKISWEIWFSLFLIFPILFFLYGKIYKWNFGLIFAKFVKK